MTAFVVCACEVAPLEPIADAREVATEGLDVGDAGGRGDDADEARDADDKAVVEELAWTLLSDESDPFAPMRPADMPPCDLRGVHVEAGAFEVDTGLCDWASFGQPSGPELEAGEVLEVIFWFGPNDGPGEALAALMLGAETLWEARVPLPTAGGFVVERVTLASAHPAGTRVLFHIHNHGANTWTLGALSRVGP